MGQIAVTEGHESMERPTLHASQIQAQDDVQDFEEAVPTRPSDELGLLKGDFRGLLKRHVFGAKSSMLLYVRWALWLSGLAAACLTCIAYTEFWVSTLDFGMGRLATKVMGHRFDDTFLISGSTMWMYTYICLPFAAMGVVAILLAALPAAPRSSLHGNPYARRVRGFFTQPCRLVRNMSVGEAILYAWLIGIQVWYVKLQYDRRIVTLHYYLDKYKSLDHVPGLSSNQRTVARYALWWSSITFAGLVRISSPFVFVPAARGSLVTAFLGLRFDQANRWHRWIGINVAVCITLHGLLLNINYFMTGNFMAQAFRWNGGGSVIILAGEIAWIGAILLGLGSLRIIRRLCYKAFYYSHILGFVLLVVFGLLHWHGLMWTWIGGLVVYGIDLTFRLMQLFHTVDVGASVSDDGTIVSLVVPVEEGTKYADGAHVWVCLPHLSAFEYHPFSIATSPCDPAWESHLLLHCKAFNRWTKALAALAQQHSVLPARAQGPFDGATVDLARYSRVCVIAGGSGVSGVLAMLRRAVQQSRDGADVSSTKMLAHVTVVFAARSAGELQTLAPLLCEDALDAGLQLHAFYTGKSPLPIGEYGSRRLMRGVGGGALAPQEVFFYEAQTELRASQRLPRLTRGRFQLLAVWLLTHLATFAVLTCDDSWLYYAAQKGLLNLHPNYMVVFFMVASCALVPLLILTSWTLLARLWRDSRPRQSIAALEPACKDGAADSADAAWIEPGTSKTSYERVPLTAGADVACERAAPLGLKQHDAVPDLVHFLQAEADGEVAISRSADGKGVAVCTGRPDIETLIRDCLMDVPAAADQPVGVWTAGPSGMNAAVVAAVRAAKAFTDCSTDVEVHQVTFEL